MPIDELRMSRLIDNRRGPIVSYFVRILFVLIGTFIGAVAVNNFLVPSHILAGGVTGITQLIHHFLNVPIGTLFFLFNIPLFLLGYRYLGKRFVLLTGIGIVAFSVFTDSVHLTFRAPVNDPLLMALYGGVLLGIGSGMVFRTGGSTGGTDVISMVLNRLMGVSIGGIGFVLNVVVVLLSLSVFGIEAGMYTLVSMFASSRVVNAMMHFQQRKTALIVTSKATEISHQIANIMERGSTLINASGTYSKQDMSVIMCALTHLEIIDLRTIVTAIDENAFITVLDTTEVIGKFRNIPV